VAACLRRTDRIGTGLIAATDHDRPSWFPAIVDCLKLGAAAEAEVADLSKRIRLAASAHAWQCPLMFYGAVLSYQARGEPVCTNLAALIDGEIDIDR
jgi:hypothetical protein